MFQVKLNLKTVGHDQRKDRWAYPHTCYIYICYILIQSHQAGARGCPSSFPRRGTCRVKYSPSTGIFGGGEESVLMGSAGEEVRDGEKG